MPVNNYTQGTYIEFIILEGRSNTTPLEYLIIAAIIF